MGGKEKQITEQYIYGMWFSYGSKTKQNVCIYKYKSMYTHRKEVWIGYTLNC